MAAAPSIADGPAPVHDPKRNPVWGKSAAPVVSRAGAAGGTYEEERLLESRPDVAGTVHAHRHVVGV
jgi:hypothetical protein